jgi:hypothetical protein
VKNWLQGIDDETIGKELEKEDDDVLLPV